jgi:hypothetical protein
VTVPKLDVVTTNQFLRGFLCRFIVGAFAQDFCAKEMTVSADDAGAITWRCATPLKGGSAKLTVTNDCQG